MELKPNPICKRGERNTYCPFYSGCLDHAVNQFWYYWSCSKCPYKRVQTFDEAGYSANGQGLGYEFSPDIIKKIRGNESG